MSLQRLSTTLALVIAAITALACAALSPYALTVAGNNMHLDWKTLADIGQAYGATSAFISAVALAGVAASIAYQVRAVRQQRQQAVRDQQRELLMLLASDPETYAPAFPRARAAMDPLDLRRDVYTQMRLQFYAFGYETGHFAEESVQSKDGAVGLFDSECMRRHWARVRLTWLSDSNPKMRRFARIVDDGYHKALAAEPLPDAESSQPVKADVRESGLNIVRLAAGAAVLVAAGWLAGRRRP